ncbi:HD domain-containing protein [Streptomyces tsukubensis]|uniref:Phosphohydrolase n=1 Tax=Streptomyces tsukubensis TaxID=83656 RepID=A0A1V4A1Q8_9ACTN|nr:HD domain-containing protein [Streptomyces tsukubensis]OON72908.1 phosphohydrolase [Streptomyces tsukubensis]QFR94490.1 HD domain-containing protein [Streptomyces tsukubensis]
MRIPTPEEIRDLHRNYAPSADVFDRVHTHCEIVADIAQQLIASGSLTSGPHAVDAELVRAGCLLHDIGVYRLFDEDGRLDGRNYVRHGVLGYGILTEEGFPEALRRFCSCHTGVGITREDVVRQGLPLPPADYLAVSEEERLVMYADKFHSKTTPPRFNSPASYSATIGRYGTEKSAAFDALRADFGVPDLEALAATHGHRIV